jgi:hypothetical protein
LLVFFKSTKLFNSIIITVVFIFTTNPLIFSYGTWENSFSVLNSYSIFDEHYCKFSMLAVCRGHSRLTVSKYYLVKNNSFIIALKLAESPDLGGMDVSTT